MSNLDRVLPRARLTEIDHVEQREQDRPLPGDERLDERTPRLHARVGVPSSSEARVEGRQRRDGWRDVVDGLAGAVRMLGALLTPFARPLRTTWGLSSADAARAYPGDDLVPRPRWSWTHGIEIDAPAEEVWPWIAQIGADRGGFYSYQWLENLVGCEIRNAETVHPEWQLRAGDELRLHPRMPPLRVTRVDPGRWFVAFGAPDDAARATDRPWTAGSWLFLVERIAGRRCRVISRFRAACSDDLATRLQMGPTLLEPIGFAMDRRMLLGIKQRVERAPPRAS